MKKLLALALTLLLVLPLPACSGPAPSSDNSIVSGAGEVQFSQSSNSEEPAPESPPAVEASSGSVTAPASSESQSASSPSSGAASSTASSASSEPPPSSSSQTPAPSASAEDEAEEEESAPASKPASTRPAPSGEIRSVWVSYLELGTLLTGKSASAYRANMAKVMDNAVDFGLNTVILQVRPFSDAIYPSQYFPQSYLFTGTEGNIGEAPFDALEIAIEEAHKRGLRLEAWLNPYRVRAKADRGLSADHPVHDLVASGDAVKMGEVITYNPASERAQQLIVDGVAELVENYDIDAIHFDDYFYPTTDAAFDADWYSDYKSGGGTKSLAAWRRSNVTQLVRKVHDAIKSRDSSVQFGISPQGNMQNNLNQQFVDVEEIVKAGLVDYICPQMYFGFQNSGCPYQSTIEAFDRMTAGTGVQLYIGLASYKFNKVDTWAGNGKNEWIGTTDILKRQVESARKLSGYGGFVLYRYDSSFAIDTFYAKDDTARRQAKAEMQNLKKLL